MTTTLWTFEFCRNSIGVWDRQWHATREQAEAARAEMIREGFDPSRQDGEYGALGDVHDVSINLSRAGVLDFARTYAVDNGAD